MVVVQPVDWGIHWRVRISLKVKTRRIASQKKPATTAARVRLLLYLTCMKNRMTSEALKMAMARATTVFHGEGISNVATHVVSPVRPIRSAKMTKYTFCGTTCPAIRKFPRSNRVREKGKSKQYRRSAN